MATLKYYLGFALLSSGTFAILLNVIIIIPVFYLAFIKKTSTVYIIAFFNIVSDFGQLLTTAIFFGGSVMANHYILTEDPDNRLSKGSVFMATVFMASWYLESWIQVVMSVNRYVVIKMNQHYIFTYRSTMLLFFFLVPIPCISAYVMEYVLPCCVFIIDHEAMSYVLARIEGEIPYTNYMIIGHGITSLVVSIFCYGAIFGKIRETSSRMTSFTSNSRQKQDIKYLIQFLLISLFFVMSWMLFEICPRVVPKDTPEWSICIAFLVVLNCSSNAVIYLTANKEVQKSLKAMYYPTKSTTSVTPANAPHVEIF
ncbi:unnamed protein product [Caenorhabditis nigoni]